MSRMRGTPCLGRRRRGKGLSYGQYCRLREWSTSFLRPGQMPSSRQCVCCQASSSCSVSSVLLLYITCYILAGGDPCAVILHVAMNSPTMPMRLVRPIICGCSFKMKILLPPGHDQSIPASSCRRPPGSVHTADGRITEGEIIIGKVIHGDIVWELYQGQLLLILFPEISPVTVLH